MKIRKFRSQVPQCNSRFHREKIQARQDRQEDNLKSNFTQFSKKPFKTVKETVESKMASSVFKVKQLIKRI